MEIDPEVEETLSRHWDLADRKIRRIENGKPNYEVKNQSYYLNPPITKDTVPLDDEMGELEHFKKVRGDLGNLLNNREVKHPSYFNGAPEEIKKLLDKS
jgi:hypothetical protein